MYLPPLHQVEATPQFTGSAVHYDVDIIAAEEVDKKKGERGRKQVRLAQVWGHGEPFKPCR